LPKTDNSVSARQVCLRNRLQLTAQDGTFDLLPRQDCPLLSNSLHVLPRNEGKARKMRITETVTAIPPPARPRRHHDYFSFTLKFDFRHNKTGVGTFEYIDVPQRAFIRNLVPGFRNDRLNAEPGDNFNRVSFWDLVLEFVTRHHSRLTLEGYEALFPVNTDTGAHKGRATEVALFDAVAGS